jgi:DNA-binding transcriptional LysR family regulator
MADDLNGLSVFITVAQEKGFRAAGRRLGVSGSAVSQTIGQLEDRLGVAVFERTTRTVRMTEAGERLYATVRPALEELRAVEEEIKELTDEPSGRLRLIVSRDAKSVVNGPALAGFLRAYPRIRLDLVATEHPEKVVTQGFDAAIGLKELVPKAMTALPVSGPLRLAVIGAPSYFEQRPPPEHPRDLADHVCINWKAAADAQPYRWEFNEAGSRFSVDVDARIVTNEPGLNIDLAIAGLGLTIGYAQNVRPHIEAGELAATLQDYCAPFPGFHLYYPRRRHRSAALQALIEYVRRTVDE